jgi:hypothetical protein
VITEVDQRLLDWVDEVLGGPRASLAVPSANDAGGAVAVYLIEACQSPPARGARKPPLQLMLRYLICPQAREPKESHGHLWSLLLDASRRAERNEWTVETDPPPPSLWQSLGIPPRPAFVLRVPVRHEYEYRPAPPVTEPIVIEGSPLVALQGTVLGPRDVPVMNAIVDLPSLNQSTQTDSAGRFRFAAVPSGGQSPKCLVVRARGRRFEVAAAAPRDEQPLVIRIQLTEA